MVQSTVAIGFIFKIQISLLTQYFENAKFRLVNNMMIKVKLREILQFQKIGVNKMKPEFKSFVCDMF